MRPLTREKPLVIAHRGNSRFAPENTLTSFRQAADLGVDGVEMDLRLTADGQLVLMHDETVERTTDGAGEVAGLTLAELKRLDAGAWKGPAHADEPVPTFEEALRELRGRCTVYAEIKTGTPGARLAEVVRDADLSAGLVLLSWAKNPETTANLREHLPEAPIFELGDAPEGAGPEFFAAKAARGLRGLSLRFKTLTADFVRAAHQARMPVLTWTVNEPDQVRAALEMDCDGIASDDPALIQEIIAGRRA